MANRCRVCLDDTVTLVDVFAEICDPKLDRIEHNAAYVLRQCSTHYSVERGDAMPQYICLSCIQAAQNAYRFKLMLEQSTKNYRQLVKVKTNERKQPVPTTKHCRVALSNMAANEQTSAIDSDSMREIQSQMEIAPENENTTPPEKSDGPYVYDESRMCLIFPSESNEKEQIAENETAPKTVLNFAINLDAADDEISSSATEDINVETKIMPEQTRLAAATLKMLELGYDSTKEESPIRKNTHQPKNVNKRQATGTNDRRPLDEEDSPGAMEILMFLSSDSEDGENDTQEKLVPHEWNNCGKGLMTQFNLNRNALLHNNNKQTSESRSPSPKKKKPDESPNNRREDREENISPRKNRSTEELPCPECNKTFNSQEKLEFHINKMCHKCPQCPRFYGSKRSLRRHLEGHKPLPVFECQRCPIKFTQFEKLVMHQVTHSNDRLFNCIQCNAEFNDMTYLKIHLKLEHGQDLTGAAKLERSQETTPRSVRMDHCKEQGQLERGQSDAGCLKLDHSQGARKKIEQGQLERSPEETGTTPRSGREKIKSKQIDSEMLSPSHSTSRTLSEKLPFECTYCKKTFARRIKLVEHTRYHTGERPFSCPYCNKKFIRKIDSIKHARTHSGESPYQCLICGKAMRDRYSLQRHGLVHSSERPYTCPYCENKFGRKQSWERHILTHTGKRPFECLACNKIFRFKHYLDSHVRKSTDNAPYNCWHCGMKFEQGCVLKQHVALDHESVGGLPGCWLCEETFSSSADLEEHMRGCSQKILDESSKLNLTKENMPEKRLVKSQNR